MNKMIMFKCPYGSRLYGLETATSDYDYKKIYLPQLTDLVMNKQVKTLKDEWVEDINGMPTKIECEYIPLHKFLTDFYQGQTYALELAFSIDHDQAEIIDFRFLTVVAELKRFLTNNVKSMTGYALNQAMLYSVKGDRLEAIVKARKCLEDYAQNDPDIGKMRVDTILKQLVQDVDCVKYLHETTVKLNENDIPAIKILGKVHHGTIAVQELYSRIIEMEKDYGGRARQAMEDNGVDWKALSHALRVIDEANELLITGRLSFPFNTVERERLMKAKLGQTTFDNLSILLREGLDNLELNKTNTVIQEDTPELKERFDSWMSSTLMKLYGLNKE